MKVKVMLLTFLMFIVCFVGFFALLAIVIGAMATRGVGAELVIPLSGVISFAISFVYSRRAYHALRRLYSDQIPL